MSSAAAADAANADDARMDWTMNEDFEHAGPQHRLRGNAIAEAVAAERERCAKIADARAEQWHREGLHHKANEAAAIAADIRR